MMKTFKGHWADVPIVLSDITIVVPWQLSTGSKHDYNACYYLPPLVSNLFKVLRIGAYELSG